MRKALTLIALALSGCAVFAGGCSVPGKIGQLSEFFSDTVRLFDYVLDENDEEAVTYDTVGCEHNTAELYDLESASMNCCAYSSIELDMKRYRAEITTMTFELEFETAGDFSLLIYTDDTLQYESGVRSYVTGQTYSFVVSEMEYPATASKLKFVNAPDTEEEDGVYTGYEMRWKLKYLQIIYQERM